MKQTLLKAFSLILTLGFFTSSLVAQDVKYHRIQATIDDTKFQDLMQSGLDIDHYHYHDGILIAEVSDADLQLMKSKKVNVKYIIKDIAKNIHKHNAEIDKHADKTRAVTVPTPVNFGTGGNYGASGAVAKHFTYQDMQNELDDMRALYPNLVSVKSSIGTTIEGRSLFMVRISDNADIDENEPEVLLNAVHHAREPISMTQLIFFMWHVLENYETDKEIKTLLNSCEMYIVPCVNPDGYVYNQTTNSTGGGMWRKNRRNNGGGTFGVDDNRNYAYGWGGSGSSASGSSDVYRGTAAFSEAETQAIKNLCNSRNFITAFNYHAYGNYCIYPYSNVAVNNCPEVSFFNSLSTFLTTDNAFTYGNAQATVNYIASGGAEDWSYAEQTTKGKMYGFTPEVGLSTDGFWPAASRIIPLCNSMIVMNKNMLKITAPFAKVTTTQTATVTGFNGTIPFSIQNFSILPASYTVTVSPLSSFVTTMDAAKTFGTLTTFQSVNDVFNYTLDPLTPVGTILSFEVSTNNGHHNRLDTISVQYNCQAPGSLSTSGITLTSATANWGSIAGVTDYYLSTKLASSSTWDPEFLVSATNYTFTGLNSATSYNWRVRQDGCANNSTTQSFTTLTTCGTPSPSSSAITSSGFTINWAAISGATSYSIQTRQQGTSTWTTTTSTTNSKAITGLSASTVYEYQVNATCASGTGNYSAILTATTSAVSTVTYCASNGNNNNMEWIDNVQLGSISRTSNKETGGYINTGLSTNLVRGTSNTITYSAGFSSTVYKENWRVYIDYNNDGDFVDAGETVVSASRTGAGNFTNSFTVPAGSSLGARRMRVKMSYSTISSPCGSFSYGEVEDYTVNIVSSVANKTTPATLSESNELIAQVMPNPFMEQINIILENNYDQNTTITLMDITGKTVYNTSLSNQELSHQFNTSDLPSGVYILHILNGDKLKTVKMVK